MMSELDQTKEVLLKMFAEFHQICIDNNIRYFAVGGTMLGIARHGGFIPWDDDIDVGMPREDYNKLRQLNYESDRYLFEFHNSPDKRFSYPYGKMYDCTTTLIENTRNKIKRGVYIDIFPLDGIGNSMKEGIDNYKEIDKLKKILTFRKTVISKRRPLWKNIVIVSSYMIPDALLNEKKLSAKITAECEKREYSKYSFVGNMVGAWGFKEIMPREVFGTPQKYSFEGIEVLGVEKADEYLKNLYGDWRQLPPKEKQVSHHDYYLDLNTPYIDNMQ